MTTAMLHIRHSEIRADPVIIPTRRVTTTPERSQISLQLTALIARLEAVKTSAANLSRRLAAQAY